MSKKKSNALYILLLVVTFILIIFFLWTNRHDLFPDKVVALEEDEYYTKLSGYASEDEMDKRAAKATYKGNAPMVNAIGDFNVIGNTDVGTTLDIKEIDSNSDVKAIEDALKAANITDYASVNISLSLTKKGKNYDPPSYLNVMYIVPEDKEEEFNKYDSGFVLHVRDGCIYPIVLKNTHIQSGRYFESFEVTDNGTYVLVKCDNEQLSKLEEEYGNKEE